MEIINRLETEGERKERIRKVVQEKLEEMGEPHPIGCFLNSLYVDEWLEDPEVVRGSEDYGNRDIYREDKDAGRLYGDEKSGVSDLEEDHFWGVECQWVYDENGMRVYRR